MIRNQFEAVQGIAEVLMNNAQEPVLHHFSTVFHVQAFANLDQYCQQEIISDIATQIGTNPKTRNIGLKTMVKKLAPYKPEV